MKRNEMYGAGMFIKAKDMLADGTESGLTLTIKDVSTSTFADGDEQRVLTFEEDDRKLGLNATNWDRIAKITGQDDDDQWPGTQIVLYVQELDKPFNGHTHAIRVRAPSAAAKKPAPTPNGKAAAPAPAKPPAPKKAPPAPAKAKAAEPKPIPFRAEAATREEAWECYCDPTSGNGDEKGWAINVAKVEAESGLAEDAFGPEQWKQVASRSLPF